MASNEGKSITMPSNINEDRSNDEQQQHGQAGEVGGRGIKRTIAQGEEDDQSKDHNNHIWTERERRKKMRDMFTDLHALLPHVSAKADKSTVIDEAVNEIKSLQNTLHELQRKKLERIEQMLLSSTPAADPPQSHHLQRTYDQSSREVFIAHHYGSSIFNNNINNPIPTTILNNNNNNNNPKQFQSWSSPNVVLNICGDIAHLSVCSLNKRCLFTNICFVLDKYKIEVLSAQISSDDNRSYYLIQAKLNRAPNQFTEALVSVEETFKQAAGEILQCL